MILTIRIIFELIILILLTYTINILSIFVHEIGHANAYMIATKDNNWNVEIGTGKIICKTRKFKISFIPISGYFSSTNIKESISKNKIIALLIGGPVASLILLIILLLVRKNVNSLVPIIVSLRALGFLINYSIVLNIFLLITSALPYKPKSWFLNGYVSDGWKILKLLKNK